MFEDKPISELQKRLYGEPQKSYQHYWLCSLSSSSSRYPIGSPGCICLRALREGAKDLCYWIPRVDYRKYKGKK